MLLLGDADALDRGVVPDCPVIVLGGSDPAARVRALARADDCLARPFVYEELLARIHALLRRCPPRVELLEIAPAHDRPCGAPSHRAGARGGAVGEGVRVPRQARRDPDRVFTREQLLRDVWGFRTYVPTRTLESHASRVRRKLAAAGLPGWVVNVWGVGYKLRHVSGASRAGAPSAVAAIIGSMLTLAITIKTRHRVRLARVSGRRSAPSAASQLLVGGLTPFGRRAGEIVGGLAIAVGFVVSGSSRDPTGVTFD